MAEHSCSVSLDQVLAAIPFPTLVVDEDGRIEYANMAAAALLDPPGEAYYRKRGGEAFNCIHAHDAPEGCGHGEKCKDCLVRNSVTESFKTGAVSRRKTFLELHRAGKTVEVPILVTTNPIAVEGRLFCLLLIEDISALMQLNSLLPICCNCKKIRDDKDYWQNVENFVAEHVAEVRFSHSMCPECLKKLYPKLCESRQTTR